MPMARTVSPSVTSLALNGQGKTLGSLVGFSPAVSIDGQFVMTAAAGGVDLTAFGNPMLHISTQIVDGVLTPQYDLDISIDADTVRSNLADLFDTIGGVASDLDDSSAMSASLPLLGKSLGGILAAGNGRTLGDLLSFQRVKLDGTKTTVLADYYDKDGTHTISGLIQQLQDYLAGAGDYAGMGSLFPVQAGETEAGPFYLRGGLNLHADETQVIKVDHATGGSFSLTYDGQTTGDIAFDATAGDIEKALLGLSSLAGGDIEVIGASGYYMVSFVGALAGTNVSQMTAQGNKLTTTKVGVTPAVSVLTQTQGDSIEALLQLEFDASKLVTVDASLPADLTSALSAAGFSLSAMADLEAQVRLAGLVDIGLNLSSLMPGNTWTGTAGYLRLSPLEVDVSLATDTFSAAVGLSPQVFGGAASSISVTNGQILLDAQAEITYASGLAGSPFSLKADGQIEATLPLSANLAGLDLSYYGTPILKLSTDDLLSVRDGVVTVQKPAVSLDIRITEPCATTCWTCWRNSTTRQCRPGRQPAQRRPARHWPEPQ